MEHGGTLTYASTVGRGTIATITLPRSGVAEHAARAAFAEALA